MLWGIDDPHELEVWSPRIKLVTKLSSMDQKFPNIQKVSGGLRWIIGMLSHIRALREMGLLLRYQF
jgi:hypothetical protein